MGLALEQARLAAEGGDVPVGAVALHNGMLIAAAGNRREADGDPTAHAEILVIRAAAEALHRWRLDDVTIVVTLEPCVMCAGAIVNARIGASWSERWTRRPVPSAPAIRCSPTPG